METLLIHNIGALVTPQGKGPARGDAMRAVTVHRNAAILARDGVIAAICADGRGPDDLPEDATVLDAGGRLVTPGLVDAHTHLVFGGYRQHEVVRRLAGESYLDILASGGGILDTVRQTRAAGFDALYAKALGFLRGMSAYGVTACEVKSGYGLDIETELTQLRVAQSLADAAPMDIAATYLGAHATPPEYAGDTGAYVEFIVNEALPRVAASGLADFCDVFCEEGVFDTQQSRRILLKARELGIGLKLHADEMVPMGGGALAAELNAASADHLIAVDEAGIRALAASDTVAVLLPQTSLYLDKPFAPARRMIGAGLPVALATDFNPGSSPSHNLQLSMTLGLIKYRMAPEEILTAVTRNAACAIGMGDRLGTLEIGKQADLVIWDADDLAMVCYRLGGNLACATVKRGRVVAGGV